MASTMMAQREFDLDKRKNFSEWYNTIIYASGLIDGRYNVAGFVVHKPLATRLMRGIYALLEPELEADGHEPVAFPTVIPKENFEIEKEHVAGFVPQVFWVTKGGGEEFARPLALRPTSETAFYQMFALWIKAHSDLPMKFYQSCTVFRYEHETLPFIRGREFHWIETHDAFATAKEALGQTATDNEIFSRVLFDHLGVPVTVFKRPQWDKFPGGEETFAYDVLMPDGKMLQCGSTHYLGQNFTKAFGVKFTKADGGEEFPFSTCFGPGVWRIVAAVASVHGDNKGLILPFSVAPVQVAVVPIAKGENAEAVVKECRKIAAGLKKDGIRVVCDDSDKSPGFKYNYWEMRGVPLRVEIGGRELEAGTATVVRRDTREKKVVPLAKLADELRKEGSAMLATLKDAAEADLKAHVTEAKTKEEVKNVLESKGGFVRTHFCSTARDGEACAKELQAFTIGGKVRGTLVNKEEKPAAGAKCVVCGHSAKTVVYVAKQY
jgi:prolyl-tRNA synthetase